MLLWSVLYAVVFISGGTFSQIISSSDLNCDFSEKCFWRNGTNGMEDSGEFVSGTNLEMDEFHKITALRPEKDDVFIYSSALGGRQTALLISDTVNCQLGGASLKYWYWKTGVDVLLDICIRQPPGRIDPAALKCYDGLSSTFAQQWIFRSVELPPISQPFELLFRATYTAPLDLIALDDIQYDAILCDVRHRGHGNQSKTGDESGSGRSQDPSFDQSISKEWDQNTVDQLIPESEEEDTVSSSTHRMKRGSLPTIGYRDWLLLQKSEHAMGQTMLVVSQNVVDEDSKDYKETSTVITESTATSTLSTVETTTSALPTLSTIVTETSTMEATTTTTKAEPSATTDSVVLEDSSPVPSASMSMMSQEQHMNNMMTLLRGVAPVLPLVPALVRSLQSIDPRQPATSSFDELTSLSNAVGVDLSEFSNVRRAPPTQLYNGMPPIIPVNAPQTTVPPSNDRTNSLAHLAKKFGLLSEDIDGIEGSPGAMTTPLPNQKNSFGMDRTMGSRMTENIAAEELYSGHQTTTAPPTFSTIYPPKVKDLVRTEPHPTKNLDIKPIPNKRTGESNVVDDQLEPLDLSELSRDEIAKLEEIHRKIFRHKQVRPHREEEQVVVTEAPDLVVFKKPPRPTVSPIGESFFARQATTMAPPMSTVVPTDMLMKFKQLQSNLPQGALNDLSMLREIPNLDELTEGMDVSLLTKPGGFAKLKQEFIARYTRRLMGMPVVERRKPLPPPAVPLKISRKLLRQMLAKARKARKH